MALVKVSRLYIFVALAVLWGACGTQESSDEPAPQESERTGDRRSGPVGDARTNGSASNEAGEAAQAADAKPVVLFLGNSLSAGAGVDPDEAFPSLIQDRIDSLGWSFRVVNAGISGDTSSGGLRRIDWALREPVAVLVLELGGNDGLRGIPVEVTRSNLAEIIERTRSVYPEAEIVLAGMQIPPNLGREYTGEFRDMYPSLAEAYDTHLIPFLLEGVGGVDSLMQSDGIHPTAQGHRVVAENVWETLEQVLRELEPTAS